MSGSSSGQDAFEEGLRLKLEAYHEAALLYAAAKLGLPDRLADGASTPEQLARALHLSASHLIRFLRGLCTIGICEELADGKFALAPGGQCLRSGSPSRLAEKVQIVVGQYWAPWADLVSTLKTGKPAFEDVFGTSIADWRGKHAEQGKLFESYVIGETFDQTGAIIEVLESAAEATRVAEIGGGCGSLLAALLIAHPHLTGVVFDRTRLIEMAKPFLEGFGLFHLIDRIELVAGNLLAVIPVRADLYLLKGVLQQWNDDAASTILRNCRKAMPDGARLVIIERLLPERASNDPAAIMLDLHMMAITGGRARSLEDFERLLSAAGLRLEKATPTNSGLALIEAVPR